MRHAKCWIGDLPVLSPQEKAGLDRAFTAAVLGYSVFHIPKNLPKLPSWAWAEVVPWQKPSMAAASFIAPRPSPEFRV